jgi:hypothetical protein
MVNFKFSDPVSKFLPQIAQMKVGNEKVEAGKRILEPSEPERPMTAQDLLRHTPGQLIANYLIQVSHGDLTPCSPGRVTQMCDARRQGVAATIANQTF